MVANTNRRLLLALNVMVNIVAFLTLFYSVVANAHEPGPTIPPEEAISVADYIAVIEVVSGRLKNESFEIDGNSMILIKGKSEEVSFSFYKWDHFKSQPPLSLGSHYLVFLKENKQGNLTAIDSELFSIEVLPAWMKQAPNLDLPIEIVEDKKNERAWYTEACQSRSNMCSKYHPYLQAAFNKGSHAD